jgi:metal-responsive CopG/Arc/MetJ family transcriptional regulator
VKPHLNESVKTTVILDQALIEEIDRMNPFPTRKEFFAHPSREYLENFKHKAIDEQLAEACAEAEKEAHQVSAEWENITLETWA